MNIQYGWKCPECGAVMSPWQNCCVNCSGRHNYTITCDQSKTPQTGKVTISDGFVKDTSDGISWINYNTAGSNITLQNTISNSATSSSLTSNLDYKNLLSNNLNKLKNNI